jgi:RNA polymerase sigma-70 factor (ECF subfamily)
MRPEIIKASALLRENTPEAIEKAIGLLQSTVYSFSMKACGHREDAEDTMQDVLYRSLKHLSRFPDPATLAAWLYTVTRNRCRRIRRPQSKTTQRTLSLDELMPDDEELKRLLQASSDSPELRVINSEEQQLLHQAVLRIPPTLRIVLVLHDMEELSTEQVAQILGIQTGTVRVRLHRARLTVRKEMNKLLQANPAWSGSELQKTKREVRSEKATERAKCRELFAMLSEYLDGRLEGTRCEEMRAHIDACPNCVAFIMDLRAAIDGCRTLEAPCDPVVSSRLRELLTVEYLRMMDRPTVKQLAV